MQQLTTVLGELVALDTLSLQSNDTRKCRICQILYLH